LVSRPALKVVYTIAGRRILVDALDAWSAEAVSNVFTGWFLGRHAAESGPPDVTLRIRYGGVAPHIPHGFTEFRVNDGGICHTNGQALRLDFDGSLILIDDCNIDIWIARRYKAGSKILAQIISQAFSAGLRRLGLYDFHGAGVVPPHQDKAVLILGASGTGKSTLTMQLVAHGWNYLSDDTLLLDNDRHGLQVYALRKFFALTTDTIAALQLSKASSNSAREVKHRFTAKDLLPATQIERSRPGAVFFPIITNTIFSQVRRLTAAEAMTKLLRLSPWASYDERTAAKHLRTLAQLAKQCVSYELLACTDLLEQPALAAELMSEVHTAWK
jgi:hypothetical protein